MFGENSEAREHLIEFTYDEWRKVCIPDLKSFVTLGVYFLDHFLI